MAIKYNSVDLTSNKYNSTEVTNEEYNSTKVYPVIVPGTSFSYIGTSYASFTHHYNRGDVGLRCDSNETKALNYLNTNYPANTHVVGDIILVTSSIGFFPNTESCNDRYFEVV